MAASWGSNSGGGTGRDPAVGPVDQTYGQRSVFGGANRSTAPVDNELEIEDEQDALGYLRLVRAEARKIPHVMIAQKYGPQAFPAHLSGSAAGSEAAATSAAAQPTASRRRRRRRHWDEQDDGYSANKKRRVSHQQAVAVELSYDDDGEHPANEDSFDYDDEGCNGGYDDDKYKGDVATKSKENSSSNGAVSHDIYENGLGDSRGYYQDGAYTAAPDPVQNDQLGGAGHGTSRVGPEAGAGSLNGEDAPSSNIDAQFTTAYHAHLLARFATIRALLHQCPRPPAEVLAALPPDHDTDVGPLSTRSGTFRRWMRLLQTTDPLPAQIAAMDKVSVFRLLRVILRGLLAGGSSSSRSSRSARFTRSLGGGKGTLDVSPRTSRWLWALFARLPARGELDYREVGYIREVAKQAVMRLAHLSYSVAGDAEDEGEVEEGEAEEEEYGYGGDEWDNFDEEAAEEYADDNGDTTHQNGPDEEAQNLEDVAMDVESEPEAEAERGEQAAEPGSNSAEAKAGEAADGEEQTANPPEADTATEEDVDMHQRATLEMVLAVAGEFYGQRDLLAFRSPWPISS